MQDSDVGSRVTQLAALESQAAVIKGWGVLDQAVAVQAPLRDPMQAYLDGLTSAA